MRGQIENRSGTSTLGNSKSLPDFVIQYALSGRARCRNCEETILKASPEA